jgi:hypothetical protein
MAQLMLSLAQYFDGVSEMGGRVMVKQLGTIAILWAITAATWADEPLTDNGFTAEEKIRHGFGIGVIVGEPTGLSAKKWLSDTTAIDAAAAWSFSDFNSFQIHVDYLWHNYDLIKTKELPGQISVYYGVGGRIKLKGSNDGKGNETKDEDARLGVRVPVGLSYTFKENPVELFAEVVPLLDVVPETKLGIGAGIGARYYFNLR